LATFAGGLRLGECKPDCRAKTNIAMNTQLVRLKTAPSIGALLKKLCVLLMPVALNVCFAPAAAAAITVLGSTDSSLPASNWTVLGAAVEAPPGQYQFTDLQATNYPQRFYRVRSP
jgi:hypothetical protein